VRLDNRCMWLRLASEMYAMVDVPAAAGTHVVRLYKGTHADTPDVNGDPSEGCDRRGGCFEL